ncbi:hypothetical protein BI037_gp27 [Morganella phage vB_MmoP_MP2]|uniref:Uncharacterized protein n=1 Tax=Morganella phage vB_MmoP_MP2 TaxID=1852627 RepID=A0A192YA09_9CAUD|nr:hypothetical protein BI037_gp27 [Morganella phage vB_MmoP_MP2]ANM46392.1 hypothetical protein MP2_gp24 [Morganella phage vB_MmoP_MP2]
MMVRHGMMRMGSSKDYSEAHGLWCDGYCCMHNPKNLYYKQ